MLAGLLSAPVSMALEWADIRHSVFKINVVSQEPDYGQAWQPKNPTSSSGTGFYIGDGRIMTNAHVVAQAKYLTVQRDTDDRPVVGHVKFVGHDCDLAIVEVDDPVFLKSAEALQFTTRLPQLRKPVSTIGYPMGGEQISITEGVVSRIDFRTYAHSMAQSHILIQVDAAINPGNSGGPVVQGDKVVGVAFQSMTQAQSTGYIIPPPVITRFLRDIEDGRYDGHPDDGLITQPGAMENEITRAFHGLKAEDGGIKVAHVASYSGLAGVIEAGDVLLAIDGYKIGADGKVSFEGDRLSFKAIYDLKLVGEFVKLELMRQKTRKTIKVKVPPNKPHVVKDSLYTHYPRYYVYAGLVFMALSRDYMERWGRNWYTDAPLLQRFLYMRSDYEPEFLDNRDIIVLADRLPDPFNAYADNYLQGVLLRVNGQPVKSLETLQETVEKDAGPFLTLEFYRPKAPLVFKTAEAKAKNASIRATYGVTRDYWLGDETGRVMEEVGP